MKIKCLKKVFVFLSVVLLLLGTPYGVSFILKENAPVFIKYLEKQGLSLTYREAKPVFSFMDIALCLKEVNIIILNQKLNLGDLTIKAPIYNPYQQMIIATGEGKNALSFEAFHKKGVVDIFSSNLNLGVLETNVTGFLNFNDKTLELKGKANGLLSFLTEYISDEMMLVLSFVLRDFEQKITLDTKNNKLRFNGIPLVPINQLLK